MSRTFLRRPSPALVVACLALAVALGGTGYAAVTLPKNSVGTAQLRKNAVTTAKVRDATLRLGDFAVAERARLKGDAGMAGPKGDKGGQGPAGPAGAQGPPGMSGLERVFVASALTSDAKVIQAGCPPGKRVVGGGASVSPFPGPVVKASQPNASLTGWVASATENTPTAASWAITAHALCAVVTP